MYLYVYTIVSVYCIMHMAVKWHSVIIRCYLALNCKLVIIIYHFWGLTENAVHKNSKNLILNVSWTLSLSSISPLALYRVAQKIWHNFWYTLNLSNINRFTEFFTIGIIRKFAIILSLKIPPHLKCVATVPCEMSSVLKANWKHDDFCNNIF